MAKKRKKAAKRRKKRNPDDEVDPGYKRGFVAGYDQGLGECGPLSGVTGYFKRGRKRAKIAEQRSAGGKKAAEAALKRHSAQLAKEQKAGIAALAAANPGQIDHPGLARVSGLIQEKKWKDARAALKKIDRAALSDKHQTAHEYLTKYMAHYGPGVIGRMMGNPITIGDPRLLEVNDLYMAALYKQAKKKLKGIPLRGLSESDRLVHQWFSKAVWQERAPASVVGRGASAMMGNPGLLERIFPTQKWSDSPEPYDVQGQVSGKYRGYRFRVRPVFSAGTARQRPMQQGFTKEVWDDRNRYYWQGKASGKAKGVAEVKARIDEYIAEPKRSDPYYESQRDNPSTPKQILAILTNQKREIKEHIGEVSRFGAKADRIRKGLQRELATVEAEIEKVKAMPKKKNPAVARRRKTDISYGAKTGPHSLAKGFTPWITREGKLGGKGFLSKPRETQKKILNKCVKDYGYRSCLGSVMVLSRSRAVAAKYGRTLGTLKRYLVTTYGGPGSFGPQKNPCEFCLVSEISGVEPIMVKSNPSFEKAMREAELEHEYAHSRPALKPEAKKKPKKTAKKNAAGLRSMMRL